MANYTEWDKAIVTRAEQLVQLARYTAVDNLNTTDIDLQHAVIHNLFVHTELLQSLVYGQEGYNVPWNAASSYIRMNTELARLEGPPSCLLYTSPSPRDGLLSRMPSSA